MTGDRPPNILFLMSDEHRADVAGFAGDAIVRTPTLDMLAQTGIVFRNAYTPSPICVPGRQAMMAGQLPRTCGCRTFADDLAPGHMTFARRFAQHAYATVACGKLHHTGTDQMQGWARRIAGDTTVAPRFIPDRDAAAFARHAQPLAAVKWSDAKEVQRACIGQGPHVLADALTVQGACQFIEEQFASPVYDRAHLQQPLLLKVSLVQPHYPYTAEAGKFAYYLNRVRPFLDQPVSSHPFLSQRQVRPGEDATEREIRRATAAYYAMIEAMDDAFATVLDALAQMGQNLDDWIVVYTSDHGEMLGEHGVWEKQKFYEASVRVPLIARWPAAFAGGRTRQENVNLCDLFATLCDLAGLPIPPGLDSRSLAPLLHGAENPAWDDESVSQFGSHNLMIKRGYLKYQYYGEESPELLFDLHADPGETTNFLAAPAYADDLARFRARRAALGYGPDAPTEYVNAGY